MDSRDLGAAAADDIWEEGATILRARLDAGTWRTWFQDAHPVAFDGRRLTLAVPSRLAADHISGDYGADLGDALRSAAGSEVTVDIVVDTAPGNDEPVARPEVTLRAESGSLAVATESNRRTRAESGPWIRGRLNERYTFDRFVTGSSNRFAHAAALSVAEAPGRSYNPLFIWGTAGLGKTHLLHAIGHHVNAVFRDKRVRYSSTEGLMNEFVDAIRSKTMPAFKRRYRDLDVLLIDDVQFLERTQELQEEFFHTFNDLHAEGGQIVLSSDRPPKSINAIEDRLRSRFEWGLSTDIQPPEFETRLAILHKKAEYEHFDGMPDGVLAFIADNISDNVRELEGALIRVAAFARLNDETVVSEEMAKHVLADLLRAERPRVITPQLILEETTRMFGWTLDDLCGKSRRRPLVTARQISMYVFRELTGFSYPQIGKEFGGRDHTTVMYAVAKIEKQMAEKKPIFDQVTELIRRVKHGGGTG